MHAVSVGLPAVLKYLYMGRVGYELWNQKEYISRVAYYYIYNEAVNVEEEGCKMAQNCHLALLMQAPQFATEAFLEKIFGRRLVESFRTHNVAAKSFF